MEETLLGFDIRETWITPDPLWDAARREAFLLRPDVAKPYSVDAMVWTSLFDTGMGAGFPEEERKRLRVSGYPVPDWIGANAGLWDKLPAMLETFRGHTATDWETGKGVIVLAISWVTATGVEAVGNVGPYREPTTPLARGDSWSLLGYDVGDGSLLSGLMNCGYTAAERTQWREQWVRGLNDSHLFRETADAFAFRDWTNRRVPEHAPFFVYALYSIS